MERSTSDLSPWPTASWGRSWGSETLCREGGGWEHRSDRNLCPWGAARAGGRPAPLSAARLTCALEVHLGHQCPEGTLGGQAAGASYGRLVGEQVDGGEAFLPCCEVRDVQGKRVALTVLQCPLPQDQVHSRVTSGRRFLVQDERLVFKAVRCPSL